MANLRTNNLFGESGQDSNGSAVFNGTDYLTASNSAAFRLNQGSTEDFTMEAWIYVTGDSYMRIGRIYETSGNQRSYDLYFSDTLELKFNYSSNGTAGGVSTLNAGVVPKNEWIHVAIAHETSTTTLRLFKNGVEKATDNAPHSTYYANTTSDFELGKEFVGNISNFHITKSCKYTGDFTPSKEPIEEDSNTTVLCLNSRFNPLSDDKSNTFTQTSDGGVEASSFIPFDKADSGNVFDGPIKHNTQGYMYFPTGRTEERGRGRGIIAGGSPGTDNNEQIEFINIQSDGNAVEFGELASARRGCGGCSSSTRGLIGGGTATNPSPSFTNSMEFITIATTANGTDFGDLSSGSRNIGGVSSNSRGLFAGGGDNPALIDTIDFFTIATAGNATDFGNLTDAKKGISGVGSPTRGLFAGGYNPSHTDDIDLVTIASAGNATDFGNLTLARAFCGGVSSPTRGVWGGGGVPSAKSNVIDFVTIASAGNATDFGDLLDQRNPDNSQICSHLRGLFIGGENPGPSACNIIDVITIATTGNAKDFGDIRTSTSQSAGCSDSHGGLS